MDITERNCRVSFLPGWEKTSLQAIVKRPPVPLWSWELSNVPRGELRRLALHKETLHLLHCVHPQPLDLSRGISAMQQGQ